MTDGLNIIDLADNNTVYTYQDPTADRSHRAAGR